MLQVKPMAFMKLKGFQILYLMDIRLVLIMVIMEIIMWTGLMALNR